MAARMRYAGVVLSRRELYLQVYAKDARHRLLAVPRDLLNPLDSDRALKNGRGERDRTSDFGVPSAARYQTALHPDREAQVYLCKGKQQG